MKVTALISCYNEEKTIANILKVLIACPLIEKIIVVDAASTDQTPKIVKKNQGEKLKAIFLPKKVGKGEAIREGLKRVKTKATFLCDADIKGLKKFHINLLVKSFQIKKPQMVVGLREKKWDKLVYPLRKNLLPLIAGERIIPTLYLKKILKSPLASQWGPEIYANYYCRRNKIKITKI